MSIAIMFLYIVPLKQGLKQKYGVFGMRVMIKFLYIVPLKQGLKLDTPLNA